MMGEAKKRLQCINESPSDPDAFTQRRKRSYWKSDRAYTSSVRYLPECMAHSVTTNNQKQDDKRTPPIRLNEMRVL